MKAIQRLKQYIDYKGFSNHQFEKKNNLSNGYLGTQIKRNAYLGENILNKILDNCLDLNSEWLLTGEGEMLKKVDSLQEQLNFSSNRALYYAQKGSAKINKLNPLKASEHIYEIQDIPLYDVKVTAGVVALFRNPNETKPIDSIRIPNMPKCDGAITVTGDSMYPLIKSGDLVFYKVVQDIPTSIFFGNMYIVSLNVEGDELVVLKYVQKGKDENHLLLVSENKHHANKEVPLTMIKALALVKGNVRFNFVT